MKKTKLKFGWLQEKLKTMLKYINNFADVPPKTLSPCCIVDIEQLTCNGRPLENWYSKKYLLHVFQTTSVHIKLVSVKFWYFNYSKYLSNDKTLKVAKNHDVTCLGWFFLVVVKNHQKSTYIINLESGFCSYFFKKRVW